MQAQDSAEHRSRLLPVRAAGELPAEHRSPAGWSRIHEFQADAYAAHPRKPADLVFGTGQTVPRQCQHPDAGPALLGLLRFAPTGTDPGCPPECGMTGRIEATIIAAFGRE